MSFSSEKLKNQIKMKTRFWIKSAISAVFSLSMVFSTSCSDDNTPDSDSETILPGNTAGAFFLNQGSYDKNIEGALNFIGFSGKKKLENLFVDVNKRSLGNTPQCAVMHKGKIYIGVCFSNTIEVLDAKTMKSERQIRLTDPAKGTQPRSMVAEGDYVYISMFDGYVARLNINTYALDAVKVGPNPEIIAIHKGKLYVPNSDGNNYLNNYADGTTASVIDLSSFTVTETFTVPLNPAEFYSEDGKLFLLAKGNYSDIPSVLYEISADRSAKKIADATMAAVGDDKIYIVNAPFSNEVNINYSIYDIDSAAVTAWNPTEIAYPSGLQVDPESGNIAVSSLVYDGKYPSFTAPGYAVIYNEHLREITRGTIGAGPAFIFFNK